jgi:hypothetical protein
MTMNMTMCDTMYLLLLDAAHERCGMRARNSQHRYPASSSEAEGCDLKREMGMPITH